MPVAASPASQGFLPEGGCDRLVGHLDDRQGRQTSELHVRVDELDHRTESQRRGRRILRRGAGAENSPAKKPANKNFCAEYHAEEPAFWKRVYYWKTPLADCGNGEEDCKDYNDWVKAWTDDQGLSPAGR